MFDLDALTRWDDALARLETGRHHPGPHPVPGAARFVTPARRLPEPEEATA